MVLQLKVTGQSIAWLDNTLTVSGSDGVYTVSFEFVDTEGLPSWAELTKYAVFKNSSLPQFDAGVYMPISEGSAVIPACILTEPGRLSVGVYGQNGYYTMPTIWAPPVNVAAGCAEGEAAAAQVMTQAQNAIKYGENAKVYAEGGYVVRKVDGTIGNPEIIRREEYTKGAKQYALEADASAEAAAVSEEEASGSKTAAAASAKEAESYAKGGTNTRTGEDTDNAKYYKEQASQSAQNAAQSASAAEGFKDQAAAYAAAAQSVVDSNFLLVDKDDNDKKYLVMMYVEDGDFCVDFEDFVE